ncbi:hypothetical protein ACOME3_005307 [Neoechinorhynchus agilis]
MRRRKLNERFILTVSISAALFVTLMLAFKANKIDESDLFAHDRLEKRPKHRFPGQAFTKFDCGLLGCGQSVHEDKLHESKSQFDSSEQNEQSITNMNQQLSSDFISKVEDVRSLIIKAILEEKRERMDRGVVHLDKVIREKEKMLNKTIMGSNDVWTLYHSHISEHGLPKDPDNLSKILTSLSNSPIVAVDEMEKGTQMKLRIYLKDGNVAIAKPYRVSRLYQTPPDHFYFSDIERHNAEIAAFHVDKVLGFYRTPPTIGRILNISRDIIPNTIDDLLSTFFVSPAGNVCFRGRCKYYCDTMHAVCGKNKDLVEVSMQLLLPSDPVVTWIRMAHPFRRSYSARRIAEWENNGSYCEESVFSDEGFHSRLMLDMIDQSIFDFLIGNLDRHHLVKIEDLLQQIL